MSAAPLLYINGYPGTRNLIVAQEIVKLLGEEKAILIDNRQLIDLVAAVYSSEHPKYQQELSKERTRVIQRYVETESMRTSVVIFADCQGDDARSLSVMTEFQLAAYRSGRSFIPVLLAYELNENLRNDQRNMSKTFRETLNIHIFEIPEELVIGNKDMHPIEAAEQIVEWMGKVGTRSEQPNGILRYFELRKALKRLRR